jgi:hypothetical protein
MPMVLHRRAPPTSFTSVVTTKPPSVFRYTLILLKGRHPATNMDTVDVYSQSRSVAVPPTPPSYWEREHVYFVVPGNKARGKFETPPPPYEP